MRGKIKVKSWPFFSNKLWDYFISLQLSSNLAVEAMKFPTSCCSVVNDKVTLTIAFTQLQSIEVRIWVCLVHVQLCNYKDNNNNNAVTTTTGTGTVNDGYRHGQR